MTTGEEARQVQLDDLGRRYAESELRGDVEGLDTLLADDFVCVSPFQGRDASGQFRVTLLAVQAHDQWRIVGLHLSPIARPAADR